MPSVNARLIRLEALLTPKPKRVYGMPRELWDKCIDAMEDSTGYVVGLLHTAVMLTDIGRLWLSPEAPQELRDAVDRLGVAQLAESEAGRREAAYRLLCEADERRRQLLTERLGADMAEAFFAAVGPRRRPQQPDAVRARPARHRTNRLSAT